jgi:uncharacterized membrane protein YdbT with pleckstrin-like domain
MSYIEDSLAPDETLLYRTHLHWVMFAKPIGWFIISGLLHETNFEPLVFVSILLCLVALYLLIEAFVIFITSEFAVTSNRILAKRGFIRRSSLEIYLRNVESTRVEQGIPGRLLGYGSIALTGTGGSENSFKNISSPLKLRYEIERQASIAQR